MTAILRKFRLQWVADNVMSIILVLAAAGFVYTVISQYRMSMQVEDRFNQTDAFSQQTAAALADTNRRLDEYDMNRPTTLALLNTLKDMSGNMKAISERPATSIAVTAPPRRVTVKKKGRTRRCAQNAVRIQNYGSSYLVFTDIVPVPCR